MTVELPIYVVKGLVYPLFQML